LGFFTSNFIAWKKIPAISSAADMQEVGWPDPAAVVAIIERMLSLRAFSLMASTVEADGPADEVTLMGLAPLPARSKKPKLTLFRASPRAAFGGSEQLDVSDQHD
jgi:hypothetical protein